MPTVKTKSTAKKKSAAKSSTKSKTQAPSGARPAAGRDAKNLRTCPKGHRFYKTSDCPTCPYCEAEKVKAAGGFLGKLGAPAYRALKNAGLLTLKQLAKKSEAELLELHGMGPSSLPKLRAALKDEGLAFRESKVAAKETTTSKASKKKAPARSFKK